MLRRTSIGYEMKKKRELKVLFVSKRDCCRAPMADCIFQYLAEKNSIKPFCRFLWRSQSAGFESYHQGDLPEQMCLRVLKENDLKTMHGCRQLRQFDFNRFDYILCMEPSQLVALREMAPDDRKARLYMLGDFMKGREKVILDPYGEDLNTFRICFERLYIACEDFYFQVNEKRVS